MPASMLQKPLRHLLKATPALTSWWSFCSQMFAEWLCNVCKPLDEPPVVAHQTKKGTHFCVSLRQGTLCDCFQVQVTGSHPFF